MTHIHSSLPSRECSHRTCVSGHGSVGFTRSKPTGMLPSVASTGRAFWPTPRFHSQNGPILATTRTTDAAPRRHALVACVDGE
jgi:hypothetical protein